MGELKERVREYGEQALRELVEEGPTQPEVQLVSVECQEEGAAPARCTLLFGRWPSPAVARVEFVLREGDGTPEGRRRANVDEIKRAFNEKVYGA